MKRFLLILLAMAAFFRAEAIDSSPTFDLSIFLNNQSNSDFKTLVIPIKRVKNLIVIEARIDTLVGNFILDTGSPHLILNKTYFRGAWKSDQYASNAAGKPRVPIMRTNVGNLAIKELVFENLTADLSDLGHIENYRDIKVLGLLGVGLFTSFEIVIDLYKDVIYLHKLDKNGMVPEEEKIVKSEPILKVPFRLTNNIITLEATIGEKKLVFCLDSGAETNALSSMLSPQVLQTFRVSKRLLLLGTGGSQAEVLLGTLDEFKIGSKSFKNMHTAITNLEELGTSYGKSIDGILGNNFLVKGIISINFVTHELRMHPYDVSTHD